MNLLKPPHFSVEAFLLFYIIFFNDGRRLHTPQFLKLLLVHQSPCNYIIQTSYEDLIKSKIRILNQIIPSIDDKFIRLSSVLPLQFLNILYLEINLDIVLSHSPTTKSSYFNQHISKNPSALVYLSISPISIDQVIWKRFIVVNKHG